MFTRKAAAWLAFSIFSVISLTSCGAHSSASEIGSVSDSIPVVSTAKASRTSISNELTLTAEFEPYQEVDVMAKVAGYVRSIRVDIGDRVREGALLATLEVPEMQNDMARSAASVEATKDDELTAQNDLQQSKSARDIAHLSYTRILEVAQREPGLVPQQDVDTAHSKDLEAEAQVSAAESSLQAATQRNRMAQAEQARIQTLFNYTAITAPFTGVVTKRYASVGSMIQAGISSQTQAMPVVRLSQNDLLRLILPVPESAVASIHIGQPVDVTVTSLGNTFPGQVTRFADTVQLSTRTMDTEVDVPNPKLTLVPGMYAEVHLHLKDRKDVLSLPLDAVDGVGSESEHVYEVSSNHLLHIIPVTTGLETDSRVEILSGVHDGDLLVVGRHTGMTEGEKVQPDQAEYEK